MYRFGDSTPFPLHDNFIDTVSTAVDCCVELFRADAAVEAGKSAASEARRLADDELRRLEALCGFVDKAIEPVLGKAGAQRVSEIVARRVGDDTRALVDQARTEITRRRDEAIARSQIVDLDRRLRRALAALLTVAQLPGSQWSWRWRVDIAGAGAAELRLVVGDLVATFDAPGPDGSQWATAIRVADLAPGLELTVPPPHKKRRRGPQREPLDACEIIEVDSTPSLRRITLRPIKGRGRILLSLRDADGKAPHAARLEDDGRRVGDAHELGAGEVEILERLFARLTENERSLIAARRELASAYLGGRGVELLERPADLAEAILELLAPLVREMRLRSRVPGELILKRDLGGDRREELFVPRAALQRKFSTLDPHHQRVFEAMGLGGESTIDFAARLDTPPSGKPTLRGRSPLRGVDLAASADAAARAVSQLAEGLETAESYGFSPQRPVRLDSSQGDESEAA